MLEAHTFGGAVVTPHVLSTQAGIDILGRGGSAVDAAIAANATQGMVAPETCGIGGDLFALVHGGAGIDALNASGWAGSNVSAGALREAGVTALTQHEPAGVTIPGCVAGWFTLHERHGRLPMTDVLRRAIDLGRDGFPASTEYSRATTRMREFLTEHEAGAQLLVEGAPPPRGARVRRPNLAATLERVADEGPSAFYEGPVARAVSDAVGGLITPDDLASYTPDWVGAIHADVFGVRGWTIPPNSQGYVTLATLWIFEAVTPTRDPDDPLWSHHLVEAYRAVAAERDDHVADPRHAPLPPDALLDPGRLTAIAERVDANRVSAQPLPAIKPSGTMYLCAIDTDGLGVSLIESNFRGIGSGIGAGGAGFVLHDRGGGFTLTPGHPNELAPGKRPLHTLAPTAWTEGTRLRLLAGTRGGHQQPQILAQVAALHLGAGRSPGEAQAAPRWTISDLADIAGRSVVDVEGGVPAATIDGLTRRGHSVRSHPDRMPGWGPVSLIAVSSDGLRTAAADPRVDTASAAVR